ncbi:MAG: AsmA family protein, partial [Proteobacteria bacterium]|nr:AsmA family protein [Pseudomonadota bacterium]
MKKKFTLAGLGLAAILFAIVLSLYFYAKTDHAKNLLVNKINTSIPGTISAENLEFSLINSYVKLDGIQIKDRKNVTCFKFKSLFVDFKISSLFKKVLEITLFTVNSPEISLIIDTNGHINIIDTLISKDKNSPEKEITRKENKGLPINVVVKKAQVIEGALTFNDPDNSIELRSLNVDIIDVNLFEQHLSLTSRLKNSRITLKDKELLIKNLSIMSELEQGSKIDFNVELDSDLCVFKAKGIAYDIFKAPGIDLNIIATSHLDQLNRFLENTIELGGLAKVTLTGKGPVNNPEVAVNLDVVKLKINEDLKGDGINLSASLVDRILSIKKANLNILGSNIVFNGMADLKDFFPKGFLNPAQNPDTLKYDFSFDQKNGDFQRFEKWVKGFSGRFSSFGKITGKGIRPEVLAAKYHFNVVLEDFKQDKPETDFLDFETDITGTIEKGICKITGFNAKAGDSTVKAFGQYDIFKKILNADLNAKSQDLYSITLPLGILPVKGSVDSKINIAGRIANPEIKAMVFGKNLMAQGIFINDIQFAGAINPLGHVDIQQLVINDQDMVIDVKGSAHVFEKEFKLKDVIKANILFSGQDINPKRFFEHADIKINQEQLDSLINSNLNINANLNMVVDYTIDSSMDKINFYDIEIPVKNIKADLDLEKRKIAIALEKIASLNASIDTEKNQYQARINFNHSDLAPLFKSAGINGIKANIDGQINATGNIPVDLSEDLVKGLHAAR